MKKLFISTLLFIPIVCFSQVKSDTAKYILNESQVIRLSNILQLANDLAASSDKISANQYNAYIKQIAHIDSVLRVQYVKFHPVKDQPKKP